MTQIITIDGPASSGKNSVGHLLSKKLGYQFIDTGSIYRVFAKKVIDNELNIDDSSDLETLRNIKVEFKNGDQILADGLDVTDKLHLPNVTSMVPKVAAIRQVREIAKVTQRTVGQSQNTVMAGRDIGTEIFPEAEFKFFLTADLEVRAARRFEQLKKFDPNLTLDQVIEQTRQRDEMDSERSVSPMRVPDGAIIVDSSKKTVEETVIEMLKYISPAS